MSKRAWTLKSSFIARLIDLLLVALMAVLYGLFSFFVIYQQMARGVLLLSYFFNVGFIILGLLADKYVAMYLQSLQDRPAKSRLGAIGLRIIYTLDFNLISLKSSLYLYYIGALIFSKILALDPDIAVSYYIRAYFIFIEYGLALLVAFDKFMEQFEKAEKRIVDNYAHLKAVRLEEEEE